MAYKNNDKKLRKYGEWAFLCRNLRLYDSVKFIKLR